MNLKADLTKLLSSDKQQYRQMGKIESSINKLNAEIRVNETLPAKIPIQQERIKDTVSSNPAIKTFNYYQPLTDQLPTALLPQPKQGLSYLCPDAEEFTLQNTKLLTPPNQTLPVQPSVEEDQVKTPPELIIEPPAGTAIGNIPSQVDVVSIRKDPVVSTVPIIPSLPQQSPANTKINVTSPSSEPTSITPPLQVVQAESKIDDAAKSKSDDTVHPSVNSKESISSEVHLQEVSNENFKTVRRNEIILNHELVLMTDSNGKYIQNGKFFPKHTVKKLTCMTIDKATELLENATIKSVPKTFLIHFGTNDLDHMSKQAMSAKFLQFTSYLCKRFPCSKIIVSGLLPRRDWDTRELEDINFKIARKILDLPNAHLCHTTIYLWPTQKKFSMTRNT